MTEFSVESQCFCEYLVFRMCVITINLIRRPINCKPLPINLIYLFSALINVLFCRFLFSPFSWWTWKRGARCVRYCCWTTSSWTFAAFVSSQANHAGWHVTAVNQGKIRKKKSKWNLIFKWKFSFECAVWLWKFIFRNIKMNIGCIWLAWMMLKSFNLSFLFIRIASNRSWKT